MKKLLFILPLTLIGMTACNDGKIKQMQQERDSLARVNAELQTEYDDLVGAINDVQDGFRQINEAEGRITIASSNDEGASTREVIEENIAFIQETMQQNRDKIAQLQERLRTSNVKVDKLTKTIEMLTRQLEEQTARVQELEAELAEKNIIIAEQGERISSLHRNVSDLQATQRSNQQTMDEQERELNTVYFVFGTKKELKEQKILQHGDVLRASDFRKDYFMPIDLRVDKEIRVYSKSAKILTSHPEGSYKWVKDEKKELRLIITDPAKFWSISRYLVIQVG